MNELKYRHIQPFQNVLILVGNKETTAREIAQGFRSVLGMFSRPLLTPYQIRGGIAEQFGGVGMIDADQKLSGAWFLLCIFYISAPFIRKSESKCSNDEIRRSPQFCLFQSASEGL